MAHNAPCNLSHKDERTLNSIFNPNLPFDDVIESADIQQDEPTSDADEQAEALGMQGVQAAEQGDFLTALDWFNKAVQAAPNRASSYNNRAQLLRLKGDDEGAGQDLDKAIELSRGRGKAACQAYTQRAMLRRREGEEEAALDDFKRAANLGGKFAKEMVVALNPYSALCNQMLAEMIHKCQTGEA